MNIHDLNTALALPQEVRRPRYHGLWFDGDVLHVAGAALHGWDEERIDWERPPRRRGLFSGGCGDSIAGCCAIGPVTTHVWGMGTGNGGLTTTGYVSS